MVLTSHPYDVAFQRELDAYFPNLWAHLDLVPTLEPDVGMDLLAYLLGLACQAQNSRNITLGRAALQELPREWLLERIEVAAEPLVQLNDEWEFRRLLEVYERIDPGLLRWLALRGLSSSDEEIRLASKEALEDIEGNSTNST